MLLLPSRFAGLILAFAPLFVHRSWRHAQILLVGAILTPGQRTVTSVLRIIDGRRSCDRHDTLSGQHHARPRGPMHSLSPRRGLRLAGGCRGRRPRCGLGRRFDGRAMGEGTSASTTRRRLPPDLIVPDASPSPRAGAPSRATRRRLSSVPLRGRSGTA